MIPNTDVEIKCRCTLSFKNVFIVYRMKASSFEKISNDCCLSYISQARAAMVSGAFGGVILAVIEGLNIAITKYFAKVSLTLINFWPLIYFFLMNNAQSQLPHEKIGGRLAHLMFCTRHVTFFLETSSL